ncbi:DUF411 domain-containing protein [Halorhabdus sp. CBA1104]|uniref:DUF411 domain-containing protein n=1 Tax=Halorhabdus sp. CBA1104 TaxID=1380432 RepID=UPI001E46FE03|nr:DUF411 domain-containing protein [Halorhabdus sp. CBA1104]
MRADDRASETPLSVSGVKQYNSPGCSCCEQYASYLRKNITGDVTDTVPADIAAIKRDHGVPAEVESCHTTLLGDYAVEGHVPVPAIATLLEESPAIDGIALPGMPPGSPGMGGTKSEPFVVEKFVDGETSGRMGTF